MNSSTIFPTSWKKYDAVKTMADVFLFLRQGWNDIWKQNIIWLFSALPILVQLFFTFRTQPIQDLSGLLISLVALPILITLSLVGFIGIPYLAYCFSIGTPANVQDTLSAVRKFSARVIGCSCLGLIILERVEFVFTRHGNAYGF